MKCSAVRLAALAAGVGVAVAACSTEAPTPSGSSAPGASSAAPSATAPGLALGGLAPQDAARTLAGTVTSDAAITHLQALEDIAKRNGGNRALGTPGYRQSVDYVADKLAGAGYEVTRQGFTTVMWKRGTSELQVAGNPVEADVLSMSGSTDGTVTAPLALLPAGNQGCAAADFDRIKAGDVAVVTRGTCAFGEKVRNAAGKGAKALIVINNEPGRLNQATLGGEEPSKIPALGMSPEAAKALVDGEQVKVTVRAEVTRTETWNVLAETARGNPDAVLMVGAHLDSVDAGPGINDNGTGSAAVLETALRLGAHADVKNKVRFAFWGAEEEGLLGSERYVKQLPEGDLKKITRYLNFDMLGSPNGGYFVYDGDGSAALKGSSTGPQGSGEIEKVFTDFFATRGIRSGNSPFDGRSDYGPFIAKGIPAGGVDTGAEKLKTEAEAAQWGGTAGKAYDPNYHSAQDGLGNVNRDIYRATAPAVAWATGYFASL